MSMTTVKLQYGKGNDRKVMALTAEEILALAGFKDVKVYSAALSVESDGKSLTAMTSVQEPEFVGMYLDGADGDRELCLAHAELPSLEYSNFTTRLFAGDSETETDSPIAFMVHGRRPDKDDSRRLVYIDHDYAAARDWGTAPRFATTEKGE